MKFSFGWERPAAEYFIYVRRLVIQILVPLRDYRTNGRLARRARLGFCVHTDKNQFTSVNKSYLTNKRFKVIIIPEYKNTEI